ncbi:MAG TPA: glycosyltransferase family 39 protein [Nitrososphaeraceae archaeon]|nr:glycosyltransferase family 39 protein [Nitrososphaeraceae archaeon]
MSRIRDLFHRPLYLLLLVLTISAFFHLWNPIGYPHLLDDEGIYTGAAVRLSEGSGPQDPEIGYLWPYFGEIFLAGIFSIIGYPTSMIHYNQLDILLSVEILWLVPRVIMGILAVFDTFLVYKIAETRYNRRVALISAILFAIMPFSMFTRWILLDNILLPFLLISIFLAMSKKYPSYIDNNQNFKYILTILLSGITLGIAIFTKIPVFTMVPLIGFLIFRNSNNSFKILSAWLIPVVLIPLAWPAYAFSAGEINLWLEGIYYQTHREYAPLIFSIINIFTLDPILIALSIGALIFAAIRKDIFLLLWILPFVVFLQLIGYVSFFHLIPIFPAVCIGGTKFFQSLFKKLIILKLFERTLPFIIILGAVIYAITSTPSALISGANENNFKATAFITEYLHDHNNITLIANPFYLWVPKQIFHLEDNIRYPNYSDIPAIKTEKILFVLDEDIKNDLGYSQKNNSDNDIPQTIVIASYTDPEFNERDIKILLKLDTFHLEAPKNINLIDQNHIWKPAIDAYIHQDNKGLQIFVNTSNTNKLFSRAFLQTEIDMKGKPLLLSINFSSNSLKGTAIFQPEIRDINGSEILWGGQALINTHGRISNETFVLPDKIADKPIELRLNVITHGSGEHYFKVNNITIG